MSDAIYLALQPAAGATTFARHLAIAFERAIVSHLPTAARLLRAVAARPSRLQIVDENALAADFVNAWNHCETATISAPTLIELWVNWTRWAARVPAVADGLRVAPVEKALAALDPDHPRWPLLWSRLWASVPGEPALTEHARSWLPTHLQADGWRHVWLVLAEQAFQRGLTSPGQEMEVETLCHLAIRWLASDENLMGWSRVWELLVDARDSIAPDHFGEAVRLGLGWVERRQQAPDWNFVWEKLLVLTSSAPDPVARAARGLRVLGFEWLKDHKDHNGWSFVWQTLYHLHRSGPVHFSLVALGSEWCATREVHPSWTFVATKLMEAKGLKVGSDTAERLVEWVEQHESHASWKVKWIQLLGPQQGKLTTGQCRRLYLSGHRWLLADDEREDVPLVLQHLLLIASRFEGAEGRQRLLRTALVVLERTRDRNERHWTRLWFAAMKSADQGEPDATLRCSILEAANRWLELPGNLANRAWSQVASRVWRETGVHDDATYALAIRGILQGMIPDAAGLASFLIGRGATAAPDPPGALLPWLDEWFGGVAKTSGGFSIWMRCERAAADAIAQGKGGSWLLLRDLLKRHVPSQAARWLEVVESYRLGRTVIGRVVKTIAKKKRGLRPNCFGYIVDIGVNAFLAVEEAGLTLRSNAAWMALVGQELEFEIISLDERRFLADVSRRRLPELQRQAYLSTLEVGQVVKGTVKNIVDYGVFVNLGIIDALLHISAIGEARSKPLKELFAVGQAIVAIIDRIDIASSRLFLRANDEIAG